LSLSSVSKLFDLYNRQARIYPALIAFAPALWSLIAFTPRQSITVGNASLTALVVGCVFYGLSAIARNRGIAIEPALLESWGGWPTTVLLRHGDGTIDRNTKKRYHRELQRLCPDLKWPTEKGEREDREAADGIYRSATKKLLEARRGPQYSLILEENASYGFWRNLFGLRPISLALAFSAAVLGAAVIWWNANDPTNLRSLAQTAMAVPGATFAFVLALVYAILQWIFVTSNSVHQAAIAYAEALFRSLDAPAATVAKPRKPKPPKVATK
jgi:hypothetical protein